VEFLLFDNSLSVFFLLRLFLFINSHIFWQPFSLPRLIKEILKQLALNIGNSLLSLDIKLNLLRLVVSRLNVPLNNFGNLFLSQLNANATVLNKLFLHNPTLGLLSLQIINGIIKLIGIGYVTIADVFS
jgi:hypothetical protein